ncbi:helix-turn-helix transcriptional regulator [Erwinia pyri]|uniref:Helix-turn-helix transcriptional regulator n=1 Tax=Erwinia pyri TaxID=3062598 RepID=A0AA50DFU8_9GAMM|nr:helix-turn-helix transcriptional regulator [Erwinia sp. DE2]WLS77365.1 helix-turn-helix transcriptional regulator [Erwinia sp. DE2]
MSDKFLIDLGLRIRDRRNHIRLSQMELGEISGIDRTYLSGVENGKRNISILGLRKISVALRMPLNELLFGV